MISLSTVESLLEKVIQPAVQDQFTKKALLYQIAKKNFGISNWAGDKFFIPVGVQRFPGVIALPDGEPLLHGEASYAQAEASVKLLTGSTEIDKKVLAVKDSASVVPLLTRISEDLTNDLIMDINRQLFGTGDGVVGKASADGSSTTTLAVAPSVNGDTTAEDVITPGQYIKIGTGSANKVVSVSGNTVVLTTAQNWSSGASIYKVTANGTASDELSGLGLLFDNTQTYLGISPATYPVWKAVVDNEGGSTVALSLLDMHKNYASANKVGDVKYIFMNRTLFQKYGTLLEQNVRFEPQSVLGGGWKGLDYMGGQAQVVLDYNTPDDWVVMLSPKMLTLGELQPLQFEQGTDGRLLRKAGYMNYEIVLAGLMELATFSRAAHACLKKRVA